MTILAVLHYKSHCSSTGIRRAAGAAVLCLLPPWRLLSWFSRSVLVFTWRLPSLGSLMKSHTYPRAFTSDSHVNRRPVVGGDTGQIKKREQGDSERERTTKTHTHRQIHTHTHPSRPIFLTIRHSMRFRRIPVCEAETVWIRKRGRS